MRSEIGGAKASLPEPADGATQLGRTGAIRSSTSLARGGYLLGRDVLPAPLGSRSLLRSSDLAEQTHRLETLSGRDHLSAGERLL